MNIVFDIGGTKTRIAVSKNGKTFGGIKIFPTPKNFFEGIKMLQKSAEELTGGKKIKAVCGGIAGALDRKKERIVSESNVAGWIEKPLKKKLEKIFRTPVFLENDAALAGLGEAHFGAGKNKKIVAYITISTGVGGARIVNGRIDENFFGFEPGYQILDAGACIYKICKDGSLLDHISGSALVRHFGKKPEEISDQKIKDDLAKWLAIGLNNSIVHWSPEIVILGGSVMKIIPLSMVKKNLKSILKVFPDIPKIKKAALGDLGGLYGALVLLKQKLQ